MNGSEWSEYMHGLDALVSGQQGGGFHRAVIIGMQDRFADDLLLPDHFLDQGLGTLVHSVVSLVFFTGKGGFSIVHQADHLNTFAKQETVRL